MKVVFKPLRSGLTLEAASLFLQRIKFSESLVSKAAEELLKLYKIFISHDMTLLEINPFCETVDGQITCLDCKMQIDDNALYRQEAMGKLRDYSQERKLDALGDESGINYIGLDGTIGCLVNGAGLAMATMDIIKLQGGTPANFLDVGGGATIDQVVDAFRIILTDDKVKAILVNIFGGIMRCDVIAKGIIVAAENLKIKVPMVVRLQGTNVKEAEAPFAESSLRIFAFKNLDEASSMVVKLENIVDLAHKDNIDVSFELPI